MCENTTTPQWPPRRKHHRGPLHGVTSSPTGRQDSVAHRDEPKTPDTQHVPLPPSGSETQVSPLQDVANRKRKKTYRNGYEEAPKAPSFRPYMPHSSGHKRLKLSNSGGAAIRRLVPQPALTEARWNELAARAHVIPEGASLKEFQMQCANAVITRSGDVCIIAPTGSGKSLLWLLPLLVAEDMVSLVITPYTSLGLEGEQKTKALGFRSVFIHADQKSPQILEDTARGHYRVIFVCPEMLESPTFSLVLHAATFQGLLGAVYLDEAHLLHESHDWRPAYSRLHELRPLVGESIPLIPISATLPNIYRKSLHIHAGLRSDASLINLGNHRPELTTVVVRLEHDISSFLDLAFVLPTGITAHGVIKTILYCDDLEILTQMFWWFHTRLTSMGLPVELLDILHAGLSVEHEVIAIKGFDNGSTRILLASEKIGAGLNFQGVLRIINYLVRKGLTSAKLSQREGRGARTLGTRSTGYLMVQPAVWDALRNLEEGKASAEKVLASVDPGIQEIIQTTGCLDDVFDKWLENPPRPPHTRASRGLCCSNCYPSLRPSQELRWVAVDPSHLVAMDAYTKEERIGIYEKLKHWRQGMWKREWEEKWEEFGPNDLISDADLENVAKNAASIHTADDLREFTHLFFWSDLSNPLFAALAEIVQAINKTAEKLETKSCPSSASNHESAPDSTLQIIRSATREHRTKTKAEKLSKGETVVEFS